MRLKATIIHESMKLFSLNDFINTGINDTIEVVLTTKRSFNNHSSSKEKLFYSVLAEAHSIWCQKVLWGINEFTGKVKQILLTYRGQNLIDSGDFPEGCIFIAFSVELDDQRPHLMKEINKGLEGFKAWLKKVLEEGIEKGELSNELGATSVGEFLFAGMLGMSVLYGADNSKRTLDRSIDSLPNYLDAHVETI